jgi:hypothetical protein
MRWKCHKSSLTAEAPPDGLSMAAQALWWEAKGDWRLAHQCVQKQADAEGAWAHAYLEEWETIARALLSEGLSRPSAKAWPGAAEERIRAVAARILSLRGAQRSNLERTVLARSRLPRRCAPRNNSSRRAGGAARNPPFVFVAETAGYTRPTLPRLASTRP